MCSPGVFAIHEPQPRQYEPAHTSGIIFEWMTTHLSKVHAAAIFLMLPTLAFIVGCAALRNWQEDELLRWDAIAFIAVLRRNLPVAILAAGALAAAAVLMAAAVHMITD